MAKSLKCNDCGVLLESVKQAQTHGEVTGHINFGEHTEAITVCICQECGKKAKTDAEKALHQRHTGHNNWSAPQALDEVINTEAQMQAAKEDMDVDDAELLGKKKKAVGAEGSASTSGQEMVAPAVDEGIVKELEAMGFSHNKAVRAVYHSGGGGSESAVNWLMEHEQDPDIDQPLMVTKASEDAAAKLTPEERRKKAQDLIKAAKTLVVCSG
ncbi:hypothetical protein DUNSADRAFT_11894 [Dunaliella salina]|uniref:UBA domain-containing protein n=1 Tax=Dunaliella salina TaxID=3046 RepID=A0ABQ7H4A2_DUNSA|nr:hypothetical protein DUNSADRAFT_11894 [Dunaliella salina]|eukprot:KAF5841687.1 hypothetical protein DUNSADRAFT_11894 [Dunaliella salina]